MMSLSKERKEQRLQSYDGMMMTRRGYNAALCGLLLYGIAANFISFIKRKGRILLPLL